MASEKDITIPAIPSTPAPLPQQTLLGILFADVCGSTRIYETLGDAKARQLISRCIELMTKTAEKHGGALIKTIGDEVMCRFPGADQAAAAALEMQEAVARAAISEGGFNIAIHVGFHYGPVVIEGNDIFGDAVNLAARMVNLSKRDQVVTTGTTVEALSPKWRKSARQVDRAAVRGKQSKVDVFELVWQEAESTRIAGKAWTLPAAGAPGRMMLRMGTHEVALDETHPSVTIGRADQSDFVLKGDLISRLHARIDYRNHRFAFTDQSTNGSWVTDDAGKVSLVRHDNHVLAGSGTISFGHPPLEGQPDLLHYRVD